MKLLFLLLLIINCLLSSAQLSPSNNFDNGNFLFFNKNAHKYFDDGFYRRNNLKINLSSLLLKNYSLSFERNLRDKLSAQVGYGYQSYHSLFEKGIGKKLSSFAGLNEEFEEELVNYQVGSYSITAEMRYYFGKKKPMQGIYLGAYGRYTHFDIDNIVNTFETDEGIVYDVPFTTNSKGIGGGILLGAQWLIKDRISVDVYIVGGHWGKLKGSFESLKDLSHLKDTEKQLLKEDLEDFYILDRKYLTVEINESGAAGNLKGPFIGFRTAALSIGFIF